MVMVPGQPGTM